MKKLKWFLLVFVIFLMILIVISSCKKTKALENSIFVNVDFYLDASDSNSGCVLVYNPINFGSTDFARVYFLDSNQNEKSFYLSIVNGYLCIWYNNVVSQMTRQLQRNYCYVYAILSINDVDDYPPILNIQYGAVYYNNEGFYTEYINYDFNNISSADRNELNDSYRSGNVRVAPVYNGSLPNKGFSNAYVIDFRDYNGAFSEYTNDIREDYLTATYNISYLYELGYNTGYQAGYDEGYQEGYRSGQSAGYNTGYREGQSSGYNTGYQVGYNEGFDEGETLGYNSGYNVGYREGLNANEEIEQAYDRGFDAGYSMGHNEGIIEGYDRGYQEGYNIGLNEGMQGATAGSQAVTLIGSIFASIGSILAIQLFPGFPLGLLILVPLFFAVLGLILWIWRRN